MLNCIIIEDQPPAQRILTKYIEDSGILKLKKIFPDALKAIEYLKIEAVDLVFLDIHLPKISGFDFLNLIENSPPVILTTAFPDYALESYEHHVVDYLLKPFSFQRFLKAVSKVPMPQEQSAVEGASKAVQPPDFIFIKSGYDHIKVAFSDIVYIKAGADYSEIFTQKTKYLTPNSLKYWIDKLDEDCFCKVHKSYIININYVKKVSGNQVFLIQEEVIPIGRAFKDDFRERYIL